MEHFEFTYCDGPELSPKQTFKSRVETETIDDFSTRSVNYADILTLVKFRGFMLRVGLTQVVLSSLNLCLPIY